MAGSNEMKLVLDLLQLRKFKQLLDSAKSTEDFASLLQKIEAAMPLASTVPDFPLFSVLPTTFEPVSKWPNLLPAYSLDKNTLDRLIHAGYTLLDRESPAFGIIGDPFPGSSMGRYVLLDPDYMSLLFPPGSGQRNAGMLHRLSIQHYAPYYPILNQEKSAIFSLGAIRGHLAYHGALKGNYFEPVTVTVSSRAELDDLIARLRSHLAGYPEWQIWFRGQSHEYWTDDLTAEANKGLCPWRSIRDPSLKPSLFHRLNELRGSWQEYAATLIEFCWYATFLETALDVPAFDIRSSSETPRERLGAEFGGWDNWSVEYPDKGEVHDYSPTFRGIQKLFFFQHYGLKSSLLDITHNLNVALFFANNQVSNGQYLPTGPDPARILYIMILHKGVDQFLDSREISEHYGLLRPLRQKCGLIAGASMINRNAYARFISIRVLLKGKIECEELTPNYLFPSPEEDSFLKQLLEYQNKHGLERIKPFVLSAAG